MRNRRGDRRRGRVVRAHPGLARLGELVEQVRGAGLPVTTHEGGERPLSAAVDLSAFRIVREALTNSLKHAGPARAEVVPRYQALLRTGFRMILDAEPDIEVVGEAGDGESAVRLARAAGRGVGHPHAGDGRRAGDPRAGARG